MLPIQELKNIHPNSDIYIIGTGASLALFPKDMLKNKITIGLNKAWENITTLNYSVTIHPELNIDLKNDYCIKKIKWIIKDKKLEQIKKDDIKKINNLYYFRTLEGHSTHLPNQPKSTSRDVKLISPDTSDVLYQWSTISATAMHIAYIMGAKNIYLVGCDCAPINGIDHVKSQHTRWRGSSPKNRYFQYKQAVVEVRDRLHELNVNVINLLPLIGINNYEWEFKHLLNVRKLVIEKSKGDIDKLRFIDWYQWLKHYIYQLFSRLK